MAYLIIGSVASAVLLRPYLPSALSDFASRIIWYPSMIGRKFNFDKIDDKIYLGGIPRSEDDVNVLKNLGVKNIISLNRKWELYFSGEEYKKNGITLHHFECVDCQPPTLANVRDILAVVHDTRDPVYIHCRAGKGRSAAAVGCYLIETQKLSAENAYKFTKDRRPRVNMNSVQRNFLETFAASESPMAWSAVPRL
jgi:protein-tyrosine phosphatase